MNVKILDVVRYSTQYVRSLYILLLILIPLPLIQRRHAEYFLHMRNHHITVDRIAARVQQYFQRREPFRISHGSTNSTRPTSHHESTVDISSLSRVIIIDPDSKTALVEPNVPMDRLVESTLQYGLIPPVVMEFPGITTGGGFAGTGGESSSFKYGYFNETVKSIELVLGNGDIITASDTENQDLFHGASGAVGSLGITTLLEIQLIQAKRYVKVTYHPTRSIPEAIQKIKQETRNSALDYLDGILFSQEHGAVITGLLTDDIPAFAHIQRFSDAADPWYYLHVKEKTFKSIEPTVEYIPLPEYLFRYDRGGFWVGASAFEYFKFPFNRYTRWFLDDFLHTRMLYKALHASEQSQNYIIQDLALPFSTAAPFIDYTIHSFDIWPLWLCPLRQTRIPTFHPHSPEPEPEPDGHALTTMLNIGLWGFGPTDHDRFVTKNRELESKVRELGGMKWLYAHTYYTEDEFWQLFDRAWYDRLRRKYHAESLPSVWQKVRVHGAAKHERRDTVWGTWALQTWPLAGVWGVWKAIESGEYRIARTSGWKRER